MKNIVIFLFLFLFPMSAFSQKLEVVFEDKDEKVEIDTSEIHIIEGSKAIWFRNTLKSDRAKEQYRNNQLKHFDDKGISYDAEKWINYSYSLSFLLFNCEKVKYGEISVTDYNDKGEAIGIENNRYEDIKWEYPTDSLDWKIMKLLCGEGIDISTFIEALDDDSDLNEQTEMSAADKAKMQKANLLGLSLLLPHNWMVETDGEEPVYSLIGEARNKDYISICVTEGVNDEMTMLLAFIESLDPDNISNYTAPQWSTIDGVKSLEMYGPKNMRVIVVNNFPYSYSIAMSCPNKKLRNKILNNISFNEKKSE